MEAWFWSAEEGKQKTRSQPMDTPSLASALLARVRKISQDAGGLLKALSVIAQLTLITQTIHEYEGMVG